MGSEDLHHKRNASKLKRREHNRSRYEKILIVCEGEKTEPNYFSDARSYYKLNTVNVEVRGDMGSDPMSLVRFAKKRYREEKDAGDVFDKVYCVFDKDQHSNYSQALSELNRSQPKNEFFAIYSVPCFEYWLLLHFIYSTSPFSSVGGRSAGDNVVKELKRYIPDYEKGLKSVFTSLAGQLDFAKVNAERAWAESARNGTDNPSTRIHELVSFLQAIKKKS